MLETKAKVMIAGVAVLLVALIAFMVANPAGKKADNPDSGDQAAQEEQTDATGDGDSSSDGSVGNWLAQQGWYKSLDTDQKTFAVYVANNKWRDAQNSCSLSFAADGTALVTDNGQTEQHEWSLDDIEPQGGDAVHGTAVLKVDDKSYVFQCNASDTRTVEVEPDATDSYLQCSLFDEQLFRVKDAEGFSLEGTEDGTGFNEVVPADKQDQFKQDLKDWCAENVPNATSATWSGSYSVKRDGDGKRILNTFLTGNDSSKTKIYLYIASDGSWSFSTRGSNN